MSKILIDDKVFCIGHLKISQCSAVKKRAASGHFLICSFPSNNPLLKKLSLSKFSRFLFLFEIFFFPNFFHPGNFFAFQLFLLENFLAKGGEWSQGGKLTGWWVAQSGECLGRQVAFFEIALSFQIIFSIKIVSFKISFRLFFVSIQFFSKFVLSKFFLSLKNLFLEIFCSKFFWPTTAIGPRVASGPGRRMVQGGSGLFWNCSFFLNNFSLKNCVFQNLL